MEARIHLMRYMSLDKGASHISKNEPLKSHDVACLQLANQEFRGICGVSTLPHGRRRAVVPTVVSGSSQSVAGGLHGELVELSGWRQKTRATCRHRSL